MDIKFDRKSGRILSCTVEGKTAKADDVMSIDEALVPPDFMTMFPLGKYLVKNDEIVEKKNFKTPKSELEP